MITLNGHKSISKIYCSTSFSKFVSKFYCIRAKRPEKKSYMI